MHFVTSEFAVHFRQIHSIELSCCTESSPCCLSDFNLPIDFVMLEEMLVLEEPGTIIFRVIKQKYSYNLKVEASSSVMLLTTHETA